MNNDVRFFVCSIVGVFVLLSILVFSVSCIRDFFPPRQAGGVLKHFSKVATGVLTTLLKAVAPFYSYSSVPLFVNFANSKLPLNIAFSFLVSSPLISLTSVVLLTDVFG